MQRRKGQSGVGEDGKPRPAGRGWGPFSGGQLTIIVVAIAAVLIPTAAFAATGVFTSTTATPAVSGTNSSTAANARGVIGSATATDASPRFGVTGNAGGAAGVGVQGGGARYGVFSNGTLGVAAGKSLSCAGCVTPADLSSAARPLRAFAYVSKNGQVDPARSRNIEAVQIPGSNQYCVRSPGLDVSTVAPVVSGADNPVSESLTSAEVSVDAVYWADFCATPGDGGNWFGVETFVNGTQGAGDFTILVP
jgi:hypothetical protein